MSDNKRILWLLNHTTLREYELPILVDLGFEVYTPKKFPRNADNRSASVTYEYDDSLNIPLEIIEQLNEYDFYSDRFDPKILSILNEYFSFAIVAYMFPMLDNMISGFKGKIFLRAFGLTDERQNYFDFAVKVCRPGFKKRLISIGHRFWFAEGYTNLKDIEPSFMQKRTIHLPVGLPEKVIKYRNSWRGGNGKILFVCPDINVYAEAKEAYNNFKLNFGAYPHVICGAQNIPVTDDPNVLGYVSSEDYHRYYQECDVMFYHSERYRHIYYHPAEAVCYGIPLVYMSAGMLGYLGGSQLPGACKSMKEAKQKIKRILNNDVILKNNIIISQEKIYNYFSPEYCIPKWKSEFLLKVLAPVNEVKIVKKIALLPIDNNLNTLKKIESVYAELNDEINKSALSDIWSVAAGVLINKKEDKDWNKNRIYSVMREFSWREMASDDIMRVQNIHGIGERLISNSYVVPDDGLSQFMDCSIWILFGSSAKMPIAPIKPIAIYYSEDLLSCKPNRQTINNIKEDVHASSRALSEMISFC
ncbi:hypothetical protein ACKE2A_08365, partial [Yersinia enterocolitica]